MDIGPIPKNSELILSPVTCISAYRKWILFYLIIDYLISVIHTWSFCTHGIEYSYFEHKNNLTCIWSTSFKSDNFFCHILLITGQIFILFIIIESVLFRYWTKFVWKSVPSINDKFVIIFLTLFNSFISLLFALYEHMPETGNVNAFAYDLTGQIPGEFKAQLSNKFRYDIY